MLLFLKGAKVNRLASQSLLRRALKRGLLTKDLSLFVAEETISVGNLQLGEGLRGVLFLEAGVSA